MSEFYDLIEEYLGDVDDALTDIRVAVRRLWFYDFDGYPLRVWQGKGRLFTEDGQSWIGTIDAAGRDWHETPSMTDGRDGSSPTYTLGLTLPDVPDQPGLYEAIKAEQWRAAGRNVTCYMAVFKDGEALRPGTPIAFLKELRMFAPKFSETIRTESDGRLVRQYKVSVTAKDGNFGRSNIPNGTYTDTVQKRRAAELGVTLDRGCEFVALLANKTMQVP